MEFWQRTFTPGIGCPCSSTTVPVANVRAFWAYVFPSVYEETANMENTIIRKRMRIEIIFLI